MAAHDTASIRVPQSGHITRHNVTCSITALPNIGRSRIRRRQYSCTDNQHAGNRRTPAAAQDWHQVLSGQDQARP